MLWQAGRMFLGVKTPCHDITTSERCIRMVLRHASFRIQSYDRQIAMVKAANIVDEPLNMRPTRAWDTSRT